jgi:hypothetical protein
MAQPLALLCLSAKTFTFSQFRKCKTMDDYRMNACGLLGHRQRARSQHFDRNNFVGLFRDLLTAFAGPRRGTRF